MEHKELLYVVLGVCGVLITWLVTVLVSTLQKLTKTLDELRLSMAKILQWVDGHKRDHDFIDKYIEKHQ